MGPETNPEDGKKKPENGGKKEGSGGHQEPGEGPLDLSQLGFKGVAGGDEAAGSPKLPKYRRPDSLPEVELTEEELREDKELLAKAREELTELGLPPYDTSKMVEGPPVTPDDVQALFKLIRGGLDREDILRLEANIEQYRNWYDAMLEVMDIVGREIGEDFRRRN